MNRTADRLLSVGLIILLPFLAACTSSQAAVIPTADPRTPVLIDTDMSLDAIMAVLYILERPELAVKAITVAGTGEASCGPGTAHALGLVAIAQAGDIPVACGRETPLAGDHTWPPEWRQTVDGDMGISWPAAGSVATQTAPELIKATLRSASKPVIFLADGPLTNVAEALQAEPQLARKIKMIYSMGGAIDVPGNVANVPLSAPNTTAEFNVFIDPHAASLVLQSGAPITLVPLDVTNQVPLDRVFYELLSKHKSTPAAKAVYDLLTTTQAYQGAGMYFFDPLAYAIASDESLATYEMKTISVVEEEGPEVGRTKVSESGAAVRVAMTTNPERFMETYLSTLNGGEKLAIDWASARATPTLPANLLTVVYQSGKCTLEGSKQVPMGMVGVKLINQGMEKDVRLAVFTVDEGKTMADIEATTGVEPPAWVQVLSYKDASPGTEIIQTVLVKDKPLYLICHYLTPLERIGFLGPIEAIQ